MNGFLMSDAMIKSINFWKNCVEQLKYFSHSDFLSCCQPLTLTAMKVEPRATRLLNELGSGTRLSPLLFFSLWGQNKILCSVSHYKD